MAYNFGVMAGALVGALIGVLFVVIFFKLSNKNHSTKTEYDERQNIERGKAYMVGYWVESGLLMALMLFALGDIELPLEPAVLYGTVLLVSITVLSVISIFKGAFWGLNNNKKSYMIMLLVVAAINIISPVIAISNGEMVENGKLQAPFINLMCGILFVAVMVALIVRNIADKRAED